jgi:hypothetical protein
LVQLEAVRLGVEDDVARCRLQPLRWAPGSPLWSPTPLCSLIPKHTCVGLALCYAPAHAVIWFLILLVTVWSWSGLVFGWMAPLFDIVLILVNKYGTNIISLLNVDYRYIFVGFQHENMISILGTIYG